MIALPFNSEAGRVYESIVQHRQPVEWMMVAGRVLDSI
jgi:hypothetical protein